MTTQNNTKMNLSERKWFQVGTMFKEVEGVYYTEEDVKEFIQKIKATMLLIPSPTERGEFIVWLGREIDKLAGETLK